MVFPLKRSPKKRKIIARIAVEEEEICSEVKRESTAGDTRPAVGDQLSRRDLPRPLVSITW